ncbi:uncharacterized protein [Epargyreus clarus]|uniref:uncharacterized protein n=1 Tax=Epargyreus clarus TaxID=520877 RepID=UPI003C2E7CDF
MEESITRIDLTSCRICLTNKKPLCPLFKYKLSGNYAEMLTAIADVKVCSNDGLPEKICSKCCVVLEKAYLLKTVAERSDVKLRKLLAKANDMIPTKKILFDSFTDIKSEIGPLAIKNEPKWELEIDVLDPTIPKAETNMDGTDLVIANTVIRKVDSCPGVKEDLSNKPNDEYLDDDVFHYDVDDDDDDDYVPLIEKTRSKFKKPKLSDIKVFKGKPTVVRKVKVLKGSKKDIFETLDREINDRDKGRKATTITCYPLLKNGTRGAPILLKRPKDSTILKIKDKFGPITKTEKPLREVKAGVKREKLVCPVCGILTYTLGNHMAIHDEKKKFTCPHCPKTFIQKANLTLHIKQHTGIRDHICEICGSGFYTQKSLARHKLIHKGERPFSCNLCAKKFIVRCDLNRHLRIHAGYKPYKCNVCNMSFNAKHQLQNHERMHTGERPYTCQVCNVAFSYKVNLNNHVIKTHGINLKFKSIYTVTEEVLQREAGLSNEARVAISHIIPQNITDAPAPAAHETVQHTEYDV